MPDDVVLKKYNDAKKRWCQLHVDFERFKQHVESSGKEPDKLVLEDIYIALSLRDASPGGLDTFYREYGNDIRKISLKIVKKEEFADDILQEFMIEIQRKIVNYRGICSLRGWLYTVVKFYSIDYLRKIKSYEPLDNVPEKHAEDISEHLDMKYCAQFFKEIIPKAIHILKDEWQLLIRAKFFEGLSNREIATIILKTQEYNISRWLQKALEKMKKHLLKLADEKKNLISECLELFENKGYFDF